MSKYGSAKHTITPAKTAHHAELISNRVKKNFRHYGRRCRKQNIECFRLYDWDIPEVRAVVDWYKGHLVVGEYVRWQTGLDWLPTIATALGKALDVPRENIHLKQRRTKSGENEARYQKLSATNNRFVVHERDLKFWVNLDDFLDTGLFSDHRNTREYVRSIAKGHDFLNLYAYTGSFTCYAGLGEAKSTTTVDRSLTYQNWTKDNLKLNGLSEGNHRLIQSDVHQFLQTASKKGEKYTLAVVDPPSFFKDEQRGISFDINDDHPEMLSQVLRLMRSGSKVIFSTNHQRFEPKFESLNVSDIKELTPKTIPEDYRNKKIHRCWEMIAK